MQKCVQCGKEIHCGCEPTSSHGSAVLPCQQKKGSIWVHVTDEHGVNIPDFPVACTGKPTTNTDSVGIAKFDPLDAASYTITLGALPTAIAETHLLPETKVRTVTVADNAVSYAAFEVHSVFGTLVVRVVDRESGKPILDTPFPIAITGVSAQPTDSKGLLAVQLPPKTYTSVAVALTDPELTRFYRAGDPGKATIRRSEVTEVVLPVDVRKLLRLQLFDMHQPRALQDYELTVDGEDVATKGKTKDKGILEHYVPCRATGAKIVVGPDKQEIKLLFTAVKPITEVAGYQQRLEQLGYDVGPPSSTLTAELGQGLRAFQRDHKLPVTGEFDTKTKETLAKVHDAAYTYPEPSH